MKFNDEHIPDSPYLVPVIAPSDDARRLTVSSLQVRHEETSPHLGMSAAIKELGSDTVKLLNCTHQIQGILVCLSRSFSKQ